MGFCDMATKVVNRYGEPFQTRDVRRRMGFLGGDELDAESSEPPSFTQPSFSMPAVERTSDGEDGPPFFGGRGDGRS